MWPLDSILEDAALALSAEAERLDEEQAVRGIDALTELPICELIANRLAGADHTVLREQVYPASDLGSVGARPKRAQRQRCDLVLLPESGTELVVADEVAELKERDKSVGTLFQPMVEAQPLAPGGVAPEDALWLEVKTAAQFGYSGGPARGYEKAVLAPTGDASKLAEDGRIEDGAVLLVLFAMDEQTAARDSAAMVHACMDMGLPVGAPERAGFGFTERVGNAWCQITLVPVRTPGLRQGG